MAPPALKISNLRKQYPKGPEALKGIDLTVADGDFFALLGPNGAGKSTLLGIISSTVNKTAGDIEVYGYNLSTDPFNAKFQLGITPQEFNMSIFERAFDVLVTQAQYYGISTAQARKLADKHLELLGLGDKRYSCVKDLSGGMKRRLLIARAMMHNPKLLILDEPTAGVDIEIRHQMWQYIKKLNNEGVTILLTTHYLEEAEQLCRNIAIIDHGKILLTSTIKNLLASKYPKALVLTLSDTDKVPDDIPNVDILGMDKEKGTIEVKIPADMPLNDLVAGLSQSGVNVLNIRNKTNRLEELFLRLTRKTA